MALPRARPNAEPTGPEAAHIKAQDKVIASGKKLADQEKFKREEHPFDAYPRLKQQALDQRAAVAGRQFPLALLRPVLCRAGAGFLHVPAADSERHHEALAVCRAGRPHRAACAGRSANVTTRANLQVREIPPKHAVALIEGIQDLGLCSRGSGADNIRNVTGTPTAGIDPQELLDTREYAREWHYHILNDRSLTGLPRKFNVAFDGAGKIAVLEDTNDIAFAAVEVKDGFGVEPGVWFRLGIGGITGHKDFANDTGIIVKPADATKVSDAIVRVFIDLGDRTNRLKARLKYVIDGMGMEKFLVLVEEKLGHAFTRVPPEALAPRPAFDRMAHIGVHKQKQDGPELDRRRAAARQGDLRADARARQNRAGSRRRRYPPHGLAEPADPGRARRQCGTGHRRDRGDRPCDQDLGNPRRTDCLHRQCRLQVRHADTKRTAAEIADWCDPRVDDRDAAQHPSHRLPSFLRAALHQRHRPDRRAQSRSATATTPSRAFISSPAAALVRTPMSGRRCFTTSRRRMRRVLSSGC